MLYKWFQLSANFGDTEAGKRLIENCCEFIFYKNTKKECGSTPANRDGEVGTGYRGLLKLAVKHILTETDVGQLYSTKGYGQMVLSKF